MVLRVSRLLTLLQHWKNNMNKAFNTVSIIGLGYIGLPTAVAFASAGKKVLGVDVSSTVIEKINQGQSHIVETALDEPLKKYVKQGLLSASKEVSGADAFIIAVPTPVHANQQPDLSYIESAAHAIAPALKPNNLVILESTSPVGTTERVEQLLIALRPDLSFPSIAGENADIKLAYCPERVLPGKIMQEIYTNDRIIGGITPVCAAWAKQLYQSFVTGECILTNARTAEFCKLVENSFRDVNIAFANELSLICDDLNINVWELIELANRHPRVNILQPGPGVGGHCIAVDPWFIVHQSPQRAKLIKTAREVNDAKPLWVIDKLKQKIADVCTQKNCAPSSLTIACYGLAFKANVDDLRESPAIEIVADIAQWHSGKVLAVEPYINQLPTSLSSYKNLHLSDIETALQQADVILMLVDHQLFQSVVVDKDLASKLIDTRGIWSRGH